MMLALLTACDWTDERTDPGCYGTAPDRDPIGGTIDVVVHPGLYGTWWLTLLGVAVLVAWVAWGVLAARRAIAAATTLASVDGEEVSGSG